MPYTEKEAGRTFYTRHRSRMDDAVATLLIHGAGGNHLHWPRALRTLPEADVYALDLPGHGRSGSEGHKSIQAYVGSILGFMSAVGLQSVIPVGHSMGSAIALTLALRLPERVRGLVLVGSGARLRVLPAILDGLLQDFESTVETVVEYCYGSGMAEQTKRLAVGQMLEIEPRVVHGDFTACDTFDVMDILETLRTPTLIITGAEDLMTPPKYARYLAEHIRDSRLTIVEGAGHMVMLERPELVARIIGEFLSGLRDH